MMYFKSGFFSKECCAVILMNYCFFLAWAACTEREVWLSCQSASVTCHTAARLPRVPSTRRFSIFTRGLYLHQQPDRGTVRAQTGENGKKKRKKKKTSFVEILMELYLKSFTMWML